MKCELYNDNYQNFKVYNIPAKAQLVIADIPYNLGNCCHTEHYISKYGEAIYTDEKPKIKATARKSVKITNSGDYFARQFIGRKVKI